MCHPFVPLKGTGTVFNYVSCMIQHIGHDSNSIQYTLTRNFIFPFCCILDLVFFCHAIFVLVLIPYPLLHTHTNSEEIIFRTFWDFLSSVLQQQQHSRYFSLGQLNLDFANEVAFYSPVFFSVLKSNTFRTNKK